MHGLNARLNHNADLGFFFYLCFMYSVRLNAHSVPVALEFKDGISVTGR